MKPKLSLPQLNKLPMASKMSKPQLTGSSKGSVSFKDFDLKNMSPVKKPSAPAAKKRNSISSGLGTPVTPLVLNEKPINVVPKSNVLPPTNPKPLQAAASTTGEKLPQLNP